MKTALRLFLILALGASCSGDDDATTVGGPVGDGDGDGDGDGPVADDCVPTEAIPALVESDLTIGPGCFSMDETRVGGDAQLTIEPNTVIRVEAGGFLSVSRGLTAPGDGGTLLARGTEESPIVFTSAASEPLAGDWGCLFFGSDAAASEMQHVRVEYGGDDCGATGQGYQAQIVVAGPIRTLADTSSRSSAGHGMQLLLDGRVRDFERNDFGDNARPSLSVHAQQIVVPPSSTSFDEASDYIEVTGPAMNQDGTISRQTVAYRFVNAAVVGTAGAQPEITVEAGVRFELESDNFVVSAGNLVVDGTAEDPVVFSSAKSAPAAGDWGCLWYLHGGISSQNTGTPTVRHATFEYAGGPGCGNNSDWRSALVLTTDSDITGLTFDTVDGHGIIVPLAECPTNACDQTFVDLAAEPLFCDGAPRSCP